MAKPKKPIMLEGHTFYRGINEATAVLAVNKKLIEVTSRSGGYGSARNFSSAHNISNSTISGAINHPDGMTDSLLKKLGDADPKNFAGSLERVAHGRLKDDAPELLAAAEDMPTEQKNHLWESSAITFDGSAQILLGLNPHAARLLFAELSKKYPPMESVEQQ